MRAVISPSSAKCSTESPTGSLPGRNSNRTQLRRSPLASSAAVTIRRPSVAASTRGVRTPASARSASIQASSEAIAGSVW